MLGGGYSIRQLGTTDFRLASRRVYLGGDKPRRSLNSICNYASIHHLRSGIHRSIVNNGRKYVF